MRAKVLTLRYSPQMGRFDDAPLLALQQKVVLEHVREHLVQIGGEPMLVCVAEWREQPQGFGSAAARVEAAAGSPRSAPEQPAIVPADAAPPAVECPSPTPRHATSNGAARPVGELRAELTEEQRGLFDRVRSWRSRTAHAEGAPPYVILTNRQLVELVRQRPDSKAGIARIDGLGDKKVARYGESILTLLWAAADERTVPLAVPLAAGAADADPSSEAAPAEAAVEPFA